MKVTLVPKEYSVNHTDAIAKHIEKVVEYTHGRFELSDILEGVRLGEYTLWIAYDLEGIQAVVLTSFKYYPRSTYVDITFAGGEQLEKWQAPMMQLLKKWARDNDCAGLEISGRAGWVRGLAGEGAKEICRVIEIPAE